MEHAKYSILEEKGGVDFASPGSIVVKYTCDDGYTLIDTNNVVGCEYLPGDEHRHTNRRVRWTNSDHIQCGEL